MKTNSRNLLVRACSAMIQLQKMDLRAMILWLAWLGLFCISGVAQDVRIEHVTIVSPERSSPMRDATVYIHDDRIVSISRAKSAAARRPETDPEVIDGLNGWEEMHRLVDAGLTPGQIFRAATIVNAEALGLDREIGTVQPGKRANLLLLRKDPAHTIEAYDEIVKGDSPRTSDRSCRAGCEPHCRRRRSW